MGGLISSYNDTISAVDDIFFTDGIKALKHRWNKYMVRKRGYAENKPHLVTFHESYLSLLPTRQDSTQGQ